MIGRSNQQDERIKFVFRLATARYPKEKELQRLLNIYQKEYKHFQNNPKKAENLLAIGTYRMEQSQEVSSAEWAAYTIVAHTILNLNESMTKF